MIFIVKVTTNKEESALELVQDRIQKKELGTYSVAKAPGLRGYLIVEAEDRETVEESVFNLPYVKGIVGRTVPYEEIKNILEPSAETITINEGDIVEMIGQTLKGEKAKVLRVDKQKEEVEVSLLGATVPLPVRVKLDNVKVVRRAEDEEDNEEENKESEQDTENLGNFGGF